MSKHTRVLALTIGILVGVVAVSAIGWTLIIRYEQTYTRQLNAQVKKMNGDYATAFVAVNPGVNPAKIQVFLPSTRGIGIVIFDVSDIKTNPAFTRPKHSLGQDYVNLVTRQDLDGLDEVYSGSKLLSPDEIFFTSIGEVAFDTKRQRGVIRVGFPETSTLPYPSPRPTEAKHPQNSEAGRIASASPVPSR